MNPLLEKHKRLVMVASIAGSLILLAGIRWCHIRSSSADYASQKEKIEQEGRSKSVPAVQAFMCKKETFVDNLILTGNLQGGARVEMRFNREGRIAAIPVGVGDKVKKGDVIAELETGEAKIRLQQAEAELSQAVDLYKAGVIAKPRLTQARLAAQLARKEYDRSFLKAPRAGSIGEMNAQVGEFVTTQMTVATLVSVDKVFVEMGVIEKDLSKLHLDQSVQVRVETYPNLTFTGRIARIAPLVEGQSRTRTVRAEIVNKEGLLLPGMFAECRIFIHEKPEALVVPADAIQTKDGPEGHSQSLVYVIAPGDRVKAVPVEIGYQSADYTEIVQGLEPGTRVVANATGQIRDGIRVEVIEEISYESR